jgi:hypothetical protein
MPVDVMVTYHRLVRFSKYNGYTESTNSGYTGSTPVLVATLLIGKKPNRVVPEWLGSHTR